MSVLISYLSSKTLTHQLLNFRSRFMTAVEYWLMLRTFDSVFFFKQLPI